MTANLASLASMVGSKGKLGDALQARREGKFYRWRPTAIQRRMLSCTDPRCLFRGPNQVGKTEALCADVVDLMLGTARWQPDRAERHPPSTSKDKRIECWVVCVSFKQSLIVQRKLYAMLPPGVLAKGSKYTHKRGFTGQSFELTNGSLCTIVSISQDRQTLASASLDALYVDEIPTEDAWSELVARVRHKSGQIRIYFTPIGRPVGWIRKKVEAGEIVEFPTGLTLEAVWPEGALRPFQTQAQIDQFVKDVRPWERAQRVEGAWEGATLDRWCQDFRPDDHVKKKDPAGMGWRVAVGVDYGLRPGKVSIHLVAARNGHTVSPEVCYWDERRAGPDETWTMVDITAQILDMLQKNGLAYDDIDEWVGDRSAEGRSGKQSNQDLRAHLAAALGRLWSQVKHVDIPRKWAGSVAYGVGVMNSLFARDAAWVHPRCEGLVGFLSHFNGDKRDPVKDPGDSARYALLHLCDTSAWYKAV